MRNEMTRSCRLGLTFFAALLCAQGAQGQRPPEVPPGSDLLGPPLSYGTILYGEPETVDEIAPGPTPVLPNAVIAAQRVEVPARRMVLEGRLTIGRPFRVDLPAGAYFGFFRTPAGEQRCLMRVPMVTYEPPKDERRDIFPGICLVDANSDGRYEIVRFLPYLRHLQPRDMPVAPVRLIAPPPTQDGRAPRFRFFRRLRIVDSNGTMASIVLEHAGARPGQQQIEYRDDGSADRHRLELRPGATASIAGITLRVAGGPSGWRIEPIGRFYPWVALEANGSAVRAGPFYVPPRED